MNWKVFLFFLLVLYLLLNIYLVFFCIDLVGPHGGYYCVLFGTREAEWIPEITKGQLRRVLIASIPALVISFLFTKLKKTNKSSV